MDCNQLSEKMILERLATRWTGRALIIRQTVTSTMQAAKEEAGRGVVNGAVIIAATQSEGKGRLGRSWISPPGTLLASIVLYPERFHLPFLVMVSALAVADAVQQISGVPVRLKWPNDIMLGGRKIAGILLESGVTSTGKLYTVVGVGLNVNLTVQDYPEIADLAASISDTMGHPVPITDVLVAVLEHFEYWYSAMAAGEPVLESWRNRLETLGRQVTINAGNLSYEGEAVSVGADGSLILRLDDGNLKSFSAGDVSLRG
jgi:BirA family biotin operon repressor/biotin-[acetyl-CoA-carboxylase] ligase